MRRVLILLGAAASLIPTAGFAQMQGNAPSGPQPDISNSDLGSHDSFSTPDVHDMVVRQRERELSDQIEAERSKMGPSRPAKSSELMAGAAVNDKSGSAMGKIDHVDPDGVVVSDGGLKVKVPARAFGHNKAGLLLDMSKAQFDQLVAKANGSPNG